MSERPRTIEAIVKQAEEKIAKYGNLYCRVEANALERERALSDQLAAALKEVDTTKGGDEILKAYNRRMAALAQHAAARATERPAPA